MRIRQLDGLRGIAILLVIFHNQAAKYPSLHLGRVFANGWMGVDLFFVLSGFLITGILLDTNDAEGYFRNFYARRCLRIWPLYYAALVFMFVVVPWLRPSDAPQVFSRSHPWWSYLVFLQNLLVANPTGATGLLAVTWSLAVEEQFYIAWPWVVRYCSPQQIRWLATVLVCLSPVLRYVLMTRYDIDPYPNTLCRLDGLMLGALLASYVRTDDLRDERRVSVAWAVLAISLPLAFVTEAAGARWIVFSLSAAASASILYLALFSRERWVQSALSNRFLVYTGTISYGLYLLHKIPYDVADALHLQRYAALVFAACLLFSYVLAAASWRLLERPFLNLRKFFDQKGEASPRQSLLAPKPVEMLR